MMNNFKTFLVLFATFIVYDCLGQFSSKSVIDSSATGITEIITSDLNNDNLKDIIVSQKFVQNNKISYYLNQGNGLFGNQQLVDSNVFFPLSLASSDFDGNGWNDIVTFSGFSSTGYLFVYMNNTGGGYTQIVVDSNLYFPRKVKVEDIDNDNDTDIILITDTALMVYYNDGFSNYTKTLIPAGIITEFYDIAISDIDNDGFKELVVGGIKTMIFQNNNGFISYDSLRTDTIPDNNNLVFLVHLNDFDNDGDFDLVTDKNSSNLIRWFSNDGLGNFSSPITIDSNATQCFSITSSDFDNDGDLDLLTALPQLGKVVWYENYGSGSFSLPLLVYQGSVPKTDEVFSDDLNNDGLPDVIWSQELSIHLNNSNSLGIKKNKSNKSIKVYPNPASKSLNVVINEDKSTLFMYNNQGQSVISDYRLITGVNVLSLDFEPGVYLITVENINSLKSQKILIK